MPEDKAQALEEIITAYETLLDDDHYLRNRIHKLLEAVKEKNGTPEKRKQCMNDILVLIEEDAEAQQREDYESPLDVKPVYRKSTPYFELKRQLLAFRETFAC